jgi:hypothetical protein
MQYRSLRYVFLAIAVIFAVAFLTTFSFKDFAGDGLATLAAYGVSWIVFFVLTFVFIRIHLVKIK